MSKLQKSIETKIIHSGEPEPRIGGAVVMPVFQTAMYEFGGEDDYHDIPYIRLNNTPNQQVLHKKLADLENGEAALVTASGMAAITSTLLTFLSSGDHLLIQDTLYGGTHTFVTDHIRKWGISFDFIDGDSPDSWKGKVREETKVIYVETMTNPLLQIAHLKGVVGFARENDIISVIDNTFASPVNFRPPEWGFDLSCHSCTKYLNGHSDLVAGAVIGRGELIGEITRNLDHFGASLDPHACFLLHRGIKTLAVRVKSQNEGAMKVAMFLDDHPAVEHVNYPGLPGHPRYERSKELFDGFGGMLSFEPVGGEEAAERFVKGVNIPIVAPSLGGVESLVTRPATTSHSGMTAEHRAGLGISDSLVRVSVGLESPEELIDDFDRALGN